MITYHQRTTCIPKKNLQPKISLKEATKTYFTIRGSGSVGESTNARLISFDWELTQVCLVCVVMCISIDRKYLWRQHAYTSTIWRFACAIRVSVFVRVSLTQVGRIAGAFFFSVNCERVGSQVLCEAARILGNTDQKVRPLRERVDGSSRLPR